jgi:plasmid maintenance system antidote protein VapI
MKTLRDPKRRPTHPGAILREDVLPALDMTQTEFAQRLACPVCPFPVYCTRSAP